MSLFITLLCKKEFRRSEALGNVEPNECSVYYTRINGKYRLTLKMENVTEQIERTFAYY